MMLADGIEGACRAAFQVNYGEGAPPEPTMQAIGSVIDGAASEKDVRSPVDGAVADFHVPSSDLPKPSFEGHAGPLRSGAFFSPNIFTIRLCAANVKTPIESRFGRGFAPM